jgi:hypothetical protein
MAKDFVFSNEEIQTFVEHFQNEKINQCALVIVNNIFQDLSKEENENWKSNILDHIEKAASNHKNDYPKEATKAERAIGAAKFASELYVIISNMAMAGKFLTPPQSKQ